MFALSQWCDNDDLTIPSVKIARERGRARGKKREVEE